MVIDQLFASPFSLFDSPFASRAASPLDRILSLPWAGKSGLWLPALGSFANDELDPATSNVGLVLDQSRGVRAYGDNLSGLGPELGNLALSVNDLTVYGSVDVTDLGDRLRITRNAQPGSTVQVYFDSAPVVVGGRTMNIVEVLAVSEGVNCRHGATNGGGTAAVSSAYYTLGVRRAVSKVATGQAFGGIRHMFAVSRRADPAASVEGDWIEISKQISVREIPAGIGPLTQPSEALKPALSGGALGFDGLQSTMSVDLPGGGSSDCDMFFWIKTVSDRFILASASNGQYLGVADSVGGTGLFSSAGSPTAIVNGVAVSTRSEFQVAAATGGWRLVRCAGLNLSGWPTLRIDGYSSYWVLNGEIAAVAIWDNTASGPLSANQINMMDRYVKGLVS